MMSHSELESLDVYSPPSTQWQSGGLRRQRSPRQFSESDERRKRRHGRVEMRFVQRFIWSTDRARDDKSWALRLPRTSVFSTPSTRVFDHARLGRHPRHGITYIERRNRRSLDTLMRTIILYLFSTRMLSHQKQLGVVRVVL